MRSGISRRLDGVIGGPLYRRSDSWAGRNTVFPEPQSLFLLF
jgi:hypothetical protein